MLTTSLTMMHITQITNRNVAKDSLTSRKSLEQKMRFQKNRQSIDTVTVTVMNFKKKPVPFLLSLTVLQ